MKAAELAVCGPSWTGSLLDVAMATGMAGASGVVVHPPFDGEPATGTSTTASPAPLDTSDGMTVCS